MENWYPRYYYILRNKTSDKKYVGQTVQDLRKYLGSGVYWKKHCNFHGGYTRENIELIYFEWFENEKDAEKWLTMFSEINPNYWLSDEWANLTEENAKNNPFFGPSLNERKVRSGSHPFSKENKTEQLIEKQSKTRFGTEKFKAAMIEKYGVDNIMKLSSIVEKSKIKQKQTKKENKTAVGVNNPNAKGVVVNGISFNLMKEACKYFNVTTTTLNKYMNNNREVTLDLEKLNKNKNKTQRAVNSRRAK